MVELGVFLPVSNNGYIVSTAAPQYQPSYAMTKAITLLAEDLGFRFALAWSGAAARSRAGGHLDRRGGPHPPPGHPARSRLDWA